MKKFFLLILIITVWEMMAVETPYEPGQIMIQLDPAVTSETQIEILTKEFAEIELRFERQLTKRMNIWLCSYVSDRWQDEEVKRSILLHSQVLKAQFNHYIQQREIPDDTNFNLQWNMHNTGQSGGMADADIDAPEAWDITEGGVTALGDTLVIAIIDGGCDLNHSDLDLFKNIHEIPNNGIDDDGNGYVDDYHGWNAYNHSGFIPTDSHGTHVAGIAGAVGNNALGVTGVSRNAKIMPIAGESTLESVVVEAYGYVLEMRKLWNETNGALGAFVISTNASFGVDYGNPANYPLWCAIYDSLGVAGVLSSAATMNANVNIDICGDMPTACASDYLITVTNTKNDDTKNTSAGWGVETIDLGAPGTSIYSTNWNNSYSYKSGTSMAAPHLAGAVAMLFAAAPASWLQEYQLDPTKCLEIKQYLLAGVDVIPDLENVTVSGGRLNVRNSLDLMLNPSAADHPTRSPQISISNYPNPFNPSTTISFSLTAKTAQNAELEIYNIKGQKVKTLPVPESQSHTFSVIWNGDDENNKPVSSGIYFAGLKSGEVKASCKLLLMK